MPDGVAGPNPGCLPTDPVPRSPAAVLFYRGETAHVVAASRNALERRVLERLTGYLSQVTGQPAVVAQSLGAVQEECPAVVVVSPGKCPPLELGTPGDDPEAFGLATGQVQGRPVVVASGRTDRGLKRVIQRLIPASDHLPAAPRIPRLRLAESPWIAHREWTLCPWVPLHVPGSFPEP